MDLQKGESGRAGLRKSANTDQSRPARLVAAGRRTGSYWGSIVVLQVSDEPPLMNLDNVDQEDFSSQKQKTSWVRLPTTNLISGQHGINSLNLIPRN
jgi:hypothetical protein